MGNTARFVEAVEAFNRRDLTKFGQQYAVGAVVHDPLCAQPLKSRDAVEQDIADLLRAFPDAQFTLSNVIENGEIASGEFNISGKHEGPLASPYGEIPGTGKNLSLDGAVFSRFNAQGEIVEERRYYDVANMLAQLGISQ